MAKEELKSEKLKSVRTRFAPSPTGFFHVGGARTALFNYIFAKQNEGSFILRIEDTDIERSKPEYEKDILESLKWLDLNYDEGPDVGGEYGPYRQRERLDIYEKYMKKLLEEEKAYYCFCSEDELEAERQYQMSRGEAPKYSGKCRSLSKEEQRKKIEAGEPAVIRFKTPDKKVKFADLIRGKLEFDMKLVGDFTVAKNLRYPLFILAGVIDDFEMKISHVIRGEDHLSNTPKQILLQEALGFPKVQYAHLPMILGADKSKLSKRHGTTAVSEYQKDGYLPETLVNFMAFLGWNPGDEREVFSIRSLVKEFSLERVQKGGAIFNLKRLDFLNGFYIRQRSLEKLTELCAPYLIESGLITPAWGQKELITGIVKLPAGITGYSINETKENISLEDLQKIIALYQERLKKLSEIVELTDFFFKDKLQYDKILLKWKEMDNKEIKESLDRSEKLLSKIKNENWTKENLENILLEEAEKMGDRGKLLWPLRAAVTGKQFSAGPFEIAGILGREKTLKRIKDAKELLK